jgi:hypothetical protein
MRAPVARAPSCRKVAQIRPTPGEQRADGMSRALIVVLAALAGIAQSQPVDRRADPADPQARPTPLDFDSGLTRSKPSADVDPPARWREHNDRVREIGGHAGHLRAGGADGKPDRPDAPAQSGNR